MDNVNETSQIRREKQPVKHILISFLYYGYIKTKLYFLERLYETLGRDQDNIENTSKPLKTF